MKKNAVLTAIFLVANLVASLAQPLSSNQTVYIPSASNNYSFTNSDFDYYSATGDGFGGVIINSLPTSGTLNYNDIAVNQNDIIQKNIFADRTKFGFVEDANHTLTTFSFKVIDSKNTISALVYNITVKYNTPVSRFVRTDSTKYLEYKGMPYLMYAIQLRVDDYASSPTDSKYANIYQYFQKTQQVGFKDAIVPIRWDWFETKENSFNYKLIDDFLSYAKTYNLHLQFMWTGSNVCGYQYVPAYISSYPSTAVNILDFSNPNLISKEVRAVKNLMDYLGTHDTEKLVVMIQVENEPDHHGPATDLWAGGQKDAAIHLIDTLGQVIHASAADMITRVNLTGYTSTAADFANVKGINIVGRDIYVAEYPKFLTESSTCDAFWNYNHTPENGGQYKTGVNLAMSSFERANGYLMYELRTTGWRATQYDLGLYRKTAGNDWVDRDGTQNVPYWIPELQQEVILDEIKAFNEMIYKADKRIAACPASKITAFNLNDSQGYVGETKMFSTYAVKYSSSVGGEALVFEDATGEIVLMSLKDNSSFLFQSLPSNLHISIGYFDELNVWHQTSSGSIIGNKVTLNAKEVALLTSKDYSGLSGVEEITKKNSISIYPNPTDGHFSLNVNDSGIEPNKIELISLDSRLVYSKVLKSNSSFSFDIQNLKSGVYFIKIHDKNSNHVLVNKLFVSY